MGRILCILLLALIAPVFSIAQEKYPVGLKFNDFEYNKVPKRYFSVRGTRSMPQSYSLKEYCPKPLSQLDLSTSAGWAVSYAALTIIKAEQNNWQGTDILLNSLSPIYPYYKAKSGANLSNLQKDLREKFNDTENVSLVSVIDALKTYGTPTYRQLPSRNIDHVSDEVDDLAAENKISEYARLYDKYDTKLTKIAAIKTTLNENLPVIAALHVSNSFFYAKDFWQPREEFSKDLPGHAVTIVGYDDTKYGGAFEIMNSWGSEWGNEGFMWIRYDDFIEFSEEAYDIYVIPGRTNGIELGGVIELTLVNDNSQMALEQISPGYYKIAESYPSGTVFTISIKNESPAFIYAFASDLTGDIIPFFPPSLTSAALSKATSFYIPDANTPIEIDDTKGTDYLCVLFSKEDLDITGIFQEIKRSPGSFYEKVKLALDGSAVPGSDVTYNPKDAGFKLTKSNKSVVILIIEHDHR